MPASIPVEERLTNLETRMTALEQLPARMDGLESQIVQLREEMRTGHVMIVTSLTEQIQESRRHAQVLFEESLSRISVVSEGLSAQGERLAAQGELLAAQGELLAAQGERLAAQGERLTAQGELMVVHGEDLAAQRETTASLATNLAAVAVNLDESRAETRAMFDALGTRLTAIENRLPAQRRKTR